MSMPVLSMMYSSTAGSTSPERVPISTPSSGVRPMEVSTTLPPTIALREEPLPKWQMMNLQSSGFLPRNFGVSPAMKRWLVPWKP